MPKRLKELAGEATENRLAMMIRESANQIWLAGLGAFSKAQQEGSKMFEALVAEGERVQEPADERLAELRERERRRRGPGRSLRRCLRSGWRECCTP